MASDDGSDDEDAKARTGKPPSMYQLMKARMEKLIAKTDHACVVYNPPCIDGSYPLEVVLSQMCLWNCHPGRNGPLTTKLSKN